MNIQLCKSTAIKAGFYEPQSFAMMLIGIRPYLYFSGCQGTNVILFFALTSLNHFFEAFSFTFLFLLLVVLQKL